MLITPSTKKFINQLADGIRKNVKLTVEPNIFNLEDLEKFLNECDFYIFFKQNIKGFPAYEEKIGSDQSYEYSVSETNYNSNPCKYLHFAAKRPNMSISNSSNYIYFLKIVFYEFFLFIVKYCKIVMDDFSLNEGARLFVLAILLPEKEFFNCMIENIDLSSDQKVNIFNMADYFNISYVDIITRGNQLEVWKRC